MTSLFIEMCIRAKDGTGEGSGETFYHDIFTLLGL